MHFINPNDYTIIDSNIVRCILNLKTENVYSYCNIGNYKKYNNKIKELAENQEEMNFIKNIFHEKNNGVEGDFSNLRYVEMALFYSGRKLKKDSTAHKKQ